MANTIRIKRSTGSSAPGTLENAELAFAEGNKKLLSVLERADHVDQLQLLNLLVVLVVLLIYLRVGHKIHF